MKLLTKPRIIFDTDMDTDCDDAGAFAMLLEAHRSQKIELTGVIADSVCHYAAPCCEAMARYYGIHVPIGTIYADHYMDTEENRARFAAYRRHSAYCLADGRGYNRLFAEEIQKTDADYPAAARLYRQLLAGAEDAGITVLCVGMLTAVFEALASPPDDISPLSGVQLFEKKVKQVITMGDPAVISDFNWGNDAFAAERFFTLCPVPIYISAEGAEIITGQVLRDALPAEHPLRRAYEIWLGQEAGGRSSWDLIATLYAMEPHTPHLVCEELGACVYHAAEKRLYRSGADAPCCKAIHVNSERETLKNLLNDYMLGHFGGI